MTKRKLILYSLLAVTLFSFRDAHYRTASRRFFHPSPEGDIYILVVKSNYELQLYDKDGWYATYPAVFGSKSLDDKMVMGDRKTPEGTSTSPANDRTRNGTRSWIWITLPPPMSPNSMTGKRRA